MGDHDGVFRLCVESKQIFVFSIVSQEYIAAGNASKAIELCRLGLEICDSASPGETWHCFLALARGYRVQKQEQEALGLLEPELQLHGTYLLSPLIPTLVDIYKRMGDFDGAVRAFEKLKNVGEGYCCPSGRDLIEIMDAVGEPERIMERIESFERLEVGVDWIKRLLEIHIFKRRCIPSKGRL
jgi:tetratricopeptide (TPR) repeat protein